jgi:hypothetical protein
MKSFVALPLLLLARVAVAQEKATMSLDRAEEPDALLAGDAGAGAFGGEGMSVLHGLVLVKDDSWRVLVEARLRLRTFGRDGDEPTVRREDWDEPSDVAHVLRELSFTRGTVSLRAGELADASLGHGTLVRGYDNSLDPDHPHAGVRVEVRDTDVDVEALVDNYLAPRLVAGRAAARPIDDRFTLGGTAAFDLTAPETVRDDLSGDRIVTGTRNLETDGGVLAMAGADVEYLFGDRGRSWLAPYADTNVLLGLGTGLHAGAQASMPAGRLRLRAQGEYRLGSDGYLPAYADALYDLERLQFSLGRPGRDPPTKRAVAEDGGFGGQGFLAEMGLSSGSFAIAATLSHRPGPEGNLISARALAPLSRRVRISLYGHHRGLGETGSDGLMAAGGLRVRLSDHVYGLGEYAHLFGLQDDGIYRPLQIATITLGLSQPL